MSDATGGLPTTTWCGIVLLAAGAAGLMVELWAGIAILAVGGALFGRGCYRELHEARPH